MELALCDGDVATGVLPVRKAALIYGIPKSTLHVHVYSGKVRPGAGVGLYRNTLLTKKKMSS